MIDSDSRLLSSSWVGTPQLACSAGQSVCTTVTEPEAKKIFDIRKPIVIEDTIEVTEPPSVLRHPFSEPLALSKKTIWSNERLLS